MAKAELYRSQVDRRTRTLFVVACEGQRSEEIYLRFMTAGLRRVEMLPLSRPADNRSAPRHLLERLSDWKKRNPFDSEGHIELWMVFDADHPFEDRHAIDTHAVLNEATRVGISVALSNPRFELWLLLHFEDVPTCSGEWLEQRLRLHLGAYNHSCCNPAHFKGKLGDAIQRAQSSDDQTQRLSPLASTRLYQLMLAILRA